MCNLKIPKPLFSYFSYCTTQNLCLLYMWLMQVQACLLCCTYAGSFTEFKCFEMETEADSNEYSRDDKPIAGMFGVY